MSLVNSVLQTGQACINRDQKGLGAGRWEADTNCALWSSALEFQPGALPSVLCISHHANCLSCRYCVYSMSTSHSWNSQVPGCPIY